MGKQCIKHDLNRNACMLTGKFRRKGYDWWWHSFTGVNRETGEEKAMFIEFFLCNPGLAKEEPVLGQLEENRQKKIKPSYLMVKAGFWGEEAKQLHRFFAWKDVEVHMNAPYSVKAGDCFASDTKLKGSIKVDRFENAKHPEWMSDFGEMSWKLDVEKLIPFNVGYGASKLFRDIKAFEMYWHAEGMKTKYSGEVIINGETFDVIPDKCYGYADKNWGADFTSPWVWLSSNEMTSKLTGRKLENSVFDIGGGRPKVFFFPLNRKLLGAFYYEGEGYEFNFSKFWTGSKTKFECDESSSEIIWHVIQETFKYKIDVNMRCKKQEMLLVNYEAPDGAKRHNRLWNGGTGYGNIKFYRKEKNREILIDDIDVTHLGCEFGEYDRR
ncbi:MAG: hypothetical protein MJ113_01165 [Lachnospiraceae bacterium]|nr:hypothetical protein [Lachnospiraceae bacterium]